jgi:hypothetical protein
MRALIGLVLILLAAVVAAGCATGGPPLSDEERCGRFGGLWEAGACRGGSGGGGSM